MRNINDLNKVFDNYIKELKNNLIEAQRDSAIKMYQEATDRIEIPYEARNINQFVQYDNSLRISETSEDDSKIETSVFSDLLVGGDSKWADVHVGAFLEWGTGPLGEFTNTYEHGYDYTTLAPWDEHTAIQFYTIGTWGISARPHMYPALVATKDYYSERIKEVIKQSWKK